MHDLGFAQDQRLAFALGGGKGLIHQHLFAPVHMRLSGLQNYGFKRRFVDMQIIFARTAHVAQDIPAPMGLITDQSRIISEIGMIGQIIKQLNTGELDRRKRCAKLMRRGCDDTAQIG